MHHPQATKEVLAIAPKTQTSSATTTANIDRMDYDYAVIRIPFGIELNTNAVGPTISLLESDNTTVTNFATFSSSFERAAEDLVAAKQVVYHVDCKTRKRYLRLSVTTATATNDNITFAAQATLHRARIGPNATNDMVSSTNDIVVIG